jgi:hypothetical protein
MISRKRLQEDICKHGIVTVDKKTNICICILCGKELNWTENEKGRVRR